MASDMFTLEELASLRANPNTASAGFGSIRFRPEFRARMWEQMQDGVSPADILDEAGYDISVLGTRRIQALASKIRSQGRKGTFDTVHAALVPAPSPEEELPEYWAARFQELEDRVARSEERAARSEAFAEKLKEQMDVLLEAVTGRKKAKAVHSAASIQRI